MKKSLGVIFSILGLSLAIFGFVSFYLTPDSSDIAKVFPLILFYIPGLILAAIGLALLELLPISFSSRNAFTGTLAAWVGYAGFTYMIFLLPITIKHENSNFTTISVIFIAITILFMIAGRGLKQEKSNSKILCIIASVSVLIIQVTAILLKRTNSIPNGTRIDTSATFLQILATYSDNYVTLILSFLSVIIFAILFIPRKKSS